MLTSSSKCLTERIIDLYIYSLLWLGILILKFDLWRDSILKMSSLICLIILFLLILVLWLWVNFLGVLILIKVCALDDFCIRSRRIRCSRSEHACMIVIWFDHSWKFKWINLNVLALFLIWAVVLELGRFVRFQISYHFNFFLGYLWFLLIDDSRLFDN